jgi:hypothetical protein
MPNGCLEWQMCRGRDGHAYMSIATNISTAAYRVAWFLEYGVWPDRLMHTCDNPPCCDVEHLVEGDQQDNMSDKVAKNRQAFAERHGMHTLTTREVIEIRKLRLRGWKLRELSEKFDTCQSNVSYICRGETRKQG